MLGLGLGVHMGNLAALREVAFVMQIKTDNAGTSGTNQFTIPTTGTGYNYSIKTSDGQTINNVTGAYTITFPSAGTYTIKVYGVFPKVYFNNTGDKLKVLKVTNWGVYGVGVTDRSDSFYGCANLTQIASDVANWNLVTIGSNSFNECKFTSLPSGMLLNSLTNGFQMFRSSLLNALPSSMTLASLTNGDRMFIFSQLSSLPSGMTLASLTNGDRMFFQLNIASLPSGMLLNSLTNGTFMFFQCKLSSLPANMTLGNLTNGNSMFYFNLLTDLPPLMKFTNLTNGTQMFEGNTINTTRYSQLLIDMNANNPNNNVPFHGGNSKYNAAGQTARNALIARGWVITDGGLE